MKMWIKYEHDLTNNDKFDPYGLSLYTDWEILKLSVKNAKQNNDEKIVWNGKEQVNIVDKNNTVVRSFDIIEFEE